MVVFGYFLVIVVVLWVLGVLGNGQDWLSRSRPSTRSLVRLLAALVAAGLLTAGLVLGWPPRVLSTEGADEALVPILLGSLLAGGGLLLLLGLIEWEGRRALWLRTIGCLLSAAVLAVPTSLSLLLYVVALPAATMVKVDVSAPGTV
jgi:hypothetical protein